MRRFLALLAVAALVAVACGDDDGGGGAAAGFCDRISEHEEALTVLSEADEVDFNEGLAIFRDIASEAPDEIREDMTVFVEALEALASEDPEALQSLDVQRLEEASTNLERYVNQECGIELPG